MSKKKRVEGEGKVVGSISQGHGQAAFSVSFWPGESESGADGSGKDEVASSPTARSSCRTVYHVACVGGNRVNVYEVDPGKAPRGIELRQSYLDEDEREVFYACCWSCGRRRQDGSRIAMLIVGGQQGIAKVIDCGNFEVNVALAGHGNSINDARAHPVDGALLLTASKDESVRLWNIRTGTCVAVFAGDRGHRDEVLSVDVHALGGVFCSAGMDNTVKVWRLDSPRVARAIRASHEAPNPDFRPFRTAFEQFPVFSTAHVHSNYVDCARWAGSLIFSKSTANRVILWTPDPARASRSPRPDATDAAHPAAKSDAVLVLRELELAGADIWFMRFGVDPKHELVAAGNKTGKVNVWRVDAETSSPALRISQHKCNTAVRQVDFSPDSKLLACCCDDASVWVFDVSALATHQQPPRQAARSSSATSSSSSSSSNGHGPRDEEDGSAAPASSSSSSSSSPATTTSTTAPATTTIAPTTTTTSMVVVEELSFYNGAKKKEEMSRRTSGDRPNS